MTEADKAWFGLKNVLSARIGNARAELARVQVTVTALEARIIALNDCRDEVERHQPKAEDPPT